MPGDPFPAKTLRLLTSAERDLVQSSRPRVLESLTRAQLKRRIDRARRLRDKYRDLAARQRGEARGKRRARGRRPAQGAANTRRKADLFDEVAERFRVAFQEVAGPAKKRASGTRGAAVKKRAAKRTRVAPASGRTGGRPGATSRRDKQEARATKRRARHVAKRAKIRQSGKKKIHAHIGARGRRRQARRDKR